MSMTVYIIFRQRDEVLKQSFSMQKVPKDGLDAITIGSGIGGLSTAAIMAKAGKKVLVLEQHDQAGGCCHTFIDKGKYIFCLNQRSKNNLIFFVCFANDL